MKRLIFFFLLLISQLGFSQNFPEKENKLVYDLAGVLSGSETDQLEEKLRYYNDSTTTQISIVIIPELEGYEVADYANRLARKWKIGQKGQNNGLLILASMKEHKIRIEVGYGLEGTITDAISKRIIEEHIKPNFKAGNYYRGFDEAIDKIVLALKGQYKSKKKSNDDAGTAFPIVLIVLFLIFMFIFSFGRKANKLAKKNNIPFWIAWSLLNSMANNNRGRWKDFSGGGGSFGGGGGGGIDFGGFGGGDFGGGGASGDW